MDIFKFMYLKKKKKLDEKGAALANVLLIATFVMVLSSSIMSMAYSSYRRKLVNLNSKNNFYSCEAILDQIKTGLQNDLAKSTKGAIDDKFGEIYTAYKNNDQNAVINGTVGNLNRGFYDLKKLASFIKIIDGVDSSQFLYDEEDVTPKYETSGTSGSYHYSYTISLTDANGFQTLVTLSSNETVEGSGAVSLYNYEQDAGHVTFSNLTVTYSSDGYEDSITTDIRIGVSETVTTVEKTGLSIEDFSIISFGGMNLSGNAGAMDCIVEGDMYLGHEPNDKTAMYIQGSNGYNHNTVKITITGKNVIIDGDLKVDNKGELHLPNATNVYINGNVYVTDDSVIDINSSAKIYVTNGMLVSKGFSDKVKGLKLVDASTMPLFTRTDFLEEGTNRYLASDHDGSSTFYIGTKNESLYNVGGDKKKDNGKVQFVLTNQTTSNLTSGMPSIIIMQQEGQNQIQGANNFHGMLFVDGKLNTSSITAAHFYPLTSSEYKEICDLKWEHSGFNDINGKWFNQVLVDVKYFFKDSLSDVVGGGASSGGNAGGGSSGPTDTSTTTSSKVGISYVNWERE